MGGFRKYCVMHSNPSDPRAQKRPLVTAPSQMLEKATGKDGLLERHQKMQCHQLALEAGIAIIRSFQKPKETLPYRISTQNQEIFGKNMNALRAIISTIILCGKQNIPLTGHRDDSIGTASNKGNFHAILMLLGNSDGASAMSSEACGVQGRIRRMASMALNTHCNSHVLNLSVAAACRLTSVRNMIETLN